MNKVLAAIAISCSLSAFASTVTSAPLEKAPFDTKKPMFITADGAFDCKDGFDLYVRASAPPTPKPKDPKDKPVPPQGDFDSFYFAKSANPAQPPIIVSRPGIQEYTGVCLQVK